MSLLPAAAGSAQNGPAVPEAFLRSGGDLPLGRWDGASPVRSAVALDDQWSLRTGFRKGIRGLSIAGERDAGPDVAVLRSGPFQAWRDLLASLQEPSVTVEPNELAGLWTTKPALIIPSGALAGLAASEFFRAGLREYASSGGVVLCFTQQRGSDFAALPVPSGSQLSAAGWAEDSGPLFRASTVREQHPVLTGLASPAPSIETDGSLKTLPQSAVVLLARSDGRPTLLLYPVGKGWVVVAMTATDIAAERNLLGPDELMLARHLVLWAKAGGRISTAAPGVPLDLPVTVHGAEQGTAAAISIRIAGNLHGKPIDEHTMPLDVPAMGSVPLAYSATVPRDTAPGIYHLEYRLLDAAKRPLTPFVEAGNSWFSVPSPAVPSRPVAADGKEAPAATFNVAVRPAITFPGDRATMTLSLAPGESAVTAREIIVRTAGQETTVTMRGEPMDVSFDLGPLRPAAAVSYAVHLGSGRTIARGTVTAPPPLGPRVNLDLPFADAGGSLRITTFALGPGELTLIGPGSMKTEQVRADRTFELPVPPLLPSGVYPVTWEFASLTGTHTKGTLPVQVRGIEARCTGSGIVSGKSGKQELQVQIEASQAVPAQARLLLVGPDGRQRPAEERTITFSPGKQTVSLPFTFRPDQAGIWHLLYSFTTRLPDGPGLEQRTAVLASGRVAIDAGSSALIGLSLGRPMYYETMVPAEASAYIYSTGEAKVELLVDGDRVARERIRDAGLSVFTAPLGKLKRGGHILTATVAGEDLKTRQELGFLFGARLPDLVVTMRTGDIMTPVLEVGLGITNQGRVASDQVKVTLYEGDPSQGARPIGTSPVPPLEPGKQFVTILPWKLAGKAGTRELVAVVDEDRSVIEADEANNRASLTMSIPTALLMMQSQKENYAADDEIRYRARVVNFSADAFRRLTLTLQTSDPLGGVVSRQTITLPDIPSGEEREVERPFQVAVLKEGTYLISGQVAAAKPLASDSLGITILPTLLLAGTLDGTATAAVPCSPFDILFNVWDAGNIPALNGTFTVEIRSADADRPHYTKQLPFRLQPGTVRLESIDLPRGDYTVVLRGSAVNSQYDQRREYLLDRRDLTVAGPVDVARTAALFPRVLVWTGGETALTIEKALAEKIVSEAFDGQTAYHTLVGSAEAFRSQALTGVFNTYVLLEVNEIGGAIEVLQRGIERGQGVIIMGSSEHARALAESLGFRFAPVKGTASSMSFPGSTELGLTGSVPITGQVFSVSKSGAQTVAELREGKPAVSVDRSGTGKVLVSAFSPIRSALNSGSTIPYGLLLRAAVRAVMPGEERADASSVQLRVSSRTGPVRARVVETLPAGAEVLWMNPAGTLDKGTLTFEITAGQEPQNILYLFRAAGADRRTSTEMFSECRGKMVRQGKLE